MNDGNNVELRFFLKPHHIRNLYKKCIIIKKIKKKSFILKEIIRKERKY